MGHTGNKSVMFRMVVFLMNGQRYATGRARGTMHMIIVRGYSIFE